MTNDRDHPFLRPLWRRVALVVATGGWSLVEWWHGEQTWGLITAALCAYAIWAYIITFPKSKAKD